MRKQLDNVFNKVEKANDKRQFKSRQKQDDGSDLKRLLNIKVFGGYMYVIAMFFRAIEVKGNLKRKKKEVDKVRFEIKNATVLERKLRIYLTEVVEECKVKELNVPKKSLASFLKIVAEFPEINLIPGEDEDMYVIIVKEGEIL